MESYQDKYQFGKFAGFEKLQDIMPDEKFYELNNKINACMLDLLFKDISEKSQQKTEMMSVDFLSDNLDKLVEILKNSGLNDKLIDEIYTNYIDHCKSVVADALGNENDVNKLQKLQFYKILHNNWEENQRDIAINDPILSSKRLINELQDYAARRGLGAQSSILSSITALFSSKKDKIKAANHLIKFANNIAEGKQSDQSTKEFSSTEVALLTEGTLRSIVERYKGIDILPKEIKRKFEHSPVQADAAKKTFGSGRR